MSRNHDPQRVRAHFVYSRDELRALYRVSETTISNWIKKGLEPIDKHRPQLFPGFTVRRFIHQLRWPRGREIKDGKLHCPVCCRFHALKSETIRVETDEIQRIHVRGRCMACDNQVAAFGTQRGLSEIYKAASNTAGDPTAVLNGLVSGGVSDYVAFVPPQTSSSNLRLTWLYRRYLSLGHKRLKEKTVDEHLRSLAKIAAKAGQKRFEAYSLQDAIRITELLQSDQDRDHGPSDATIVRSLDHARVFFTWLRRQDQGSGIHVDLPDYFAPPKHLRRAANRAARTTEFTMEEIIQVFRMMDSDSPVEIRDKAVIAILIMTGVRADALASLLGKHVDLENWWIYQDPSHVRTKHSKYIETYCIPIDSRLRDAVVQWNCLRNDLGFGDDDAYFLPNCYLESNAVGLGKRFAGENGAEPWKSADAIRRIVADATEAAGFEPGAFGPHDFRRLHHPYLMTATGAGTSHEIALELNHGHEPSTTMRKHYSTLSRQERQALLDDLCRRKAGRTEAALVLAISHGELLECDPDYAFAKELFEQAVEDRKRFVDGPG